MNAASRLTNLSLLGVDCDHGRALQIFKGCPRLEILNMVFVVQHRPPHYFNIPAEDSPPTPIPLPQSPIVLSSLRHLSIAAATTSCKVYLEYLHTPHLQHLSVQNHGLAEIADDIAKGEKTYDIMAPFGEAVILFASRTPQLESFRIHNSALPDRHLLKVLSHMRSLKELWLSSMNVGTLVFRGLARSEGSAPSVEVRPKPALCPSLQRLHVLGCEFVVDSHIHDLVRVRSFSFLEVRRCAKVTQETILNVAAAQPHLHTWIEIEEAVAEIEDSE